MSTASAARSARRLASVTFGPRCSEPLSRSELLCLLRSESRAASRKIDLIVVHCTDTKPSQDFTIEKLKASHKREGFGEYPGYHLYIRRDGTLYYCRPLSVRGCHVRGYNEHSIGVCYEGGHAEGAANVPPKQGGSGGPLRGQSHRRAERGAQGGDRGAERDVSRGESVWTPRPESRQGLPVLRCRAGISGNESLTVKCFAGKPDNPFTGVKCFAGKPDDPFTPVKRAKRLNFAASASFDPVIKSRK